MNSQKGNLTGYNMVVNLIERLEETNINFDYEPGEIIKELFETQEIFEAGFARRMIPESKFNGNNLFTKMRRSIRNLKQKNR